MNFSEKILESAAEGIVLVKNEENALPLCEKDCVSVFGRAQYEFYRSGTGSGGSVNLFYKTNLIDSLKEYAGNYGFSINEKLCSVYEDYIQKNPFDNGGGLWASEPWGQKELVLDEALVREAAAVSNKAVFVIGRTSGEDRDYRAEKGSWFLTDEELNNLKLVCEAFDSVILVFNSSGILDTSFIKDERFESKLKAVMYAWQGGQEAGRACAAVLCGKYVPGGKLTDTIAYSIKDYPSSIDFGQKQCVYEDDIYVGYRYFNTFAKDRILYPFGYGISYTTFEYKVTSAKASDTKVQLEIEVKNTGCKFSGKEIIQVYFSAPQGKLGKPAVELCGFGKTKLIAPEKTDVLHIEFDLRDFASYDDSGVTGNQYCWLLEKGNYRIFTGTDSLSLREVSFTDGNCGVSLENDLILEKLEQACAPDVAFERIKAGAAVSDGMYSVAREAVPLNKVNLEERIKENLPAELKVTGNAGACCAAASDNEKITFDKVIENNELIDDFVAQLSVKELCTVVRGEGMLSSKITPGLAAAFGGVSQALHDYKIPCGALSDGPSGIRMDTGKQANLLPIGTQLACSWNLELIRELYVFEGKELADNRIDALLGPGMNIHRNPLNGRNFEYYSEDPFLTGEIAKVVVKGLFDGGSNGTIKHYALNSQETDRRLFNPIVSERALRQIYLKPFEAVVKAGIAKSIMTAYNALNGHWTASNYDLVNTILRKEWGYTGFVMTDWWAEMNDCVKGGVQSVKNLASMIRARNDIYMVVDNDGAENNVYGDNLEASLENVQLTVGELQLCVKDILLFLANAPVAKRPLQELKQIIAFEPLSEADAKKYEASKRLAVKQEIVPEENTDYVLKIEKSCDYVITGIYCKVEDTVSQSATNIFINGESAGSFKCRTTAGKDVPEIAGEVTLKEGVYAVRMEHTKPGITVSKLCIQPSFVNPVGIKNLVENS